MYTVIIATLDTLLFAHSANFKLSLLNLIHLYDYILSHYMILKLPLCTEYLISTRYRVYNGILSINTAPTEDARV